MTEVLVRPPNMPEFRVSVDQLRADVTSGRAPATVSVSLDGGATWIAGWQAAGLPPPPSNADDATKYFIPIGRSGWAILTGYLSLPTMFIVPVMGFFLAASIGHPSRDAIPIALTLFVLGVPVQVLTALLGHRAIRKNPKLLGMGRVIFTYVCTGLLAAFAFATIIVQLVAT